MINKKYLLMLAVGVLTLSISVCAWAAAGKFSVQADELDYDMKTGEAVATGNVIIIQDNGRATGDRATFNSKTKSGSLIGNVVADRGNEHITCDEFRIVNDNDYSAIGNATVSKEGKILQAPRVDYSKSREFAETFGSWARLTDTDGSVLRASKITYNAGAGLATATGGVTINSQARKLTASGDKAIYDTKKDGYVELIGNAEAVQDGNTIKGDKLRLTNANVAVADGNVRIKYIPEDKPAPNTTAQGKETPVMKKEGQAVAATAQA